MRNYINWTNSKISNYSALNRWYSNKGYDNLLDKYSGNTPASWMRFLKGEKEKPGINVADYDTDMDYSNRAEKIGQYYRDTDYPRTTQEPTEEYPNHVQAFKNIGYAGAILSGLSQMRDRTYLNMAANASANAELARSQMLQTGIAGTAEANALRERGDRAIGSATTGYGTMGVASDSGSAVDTQAGMAERMERNAQTITQDAMLKQWALGNEANQYEAQARTYKRMYKNNRFGGLLNMALNVAKIYYGL